MEDFFKQQAGWLQTWQEQQQKLAQEYAKWGESFIKEVDGSKGQQMPFTFESLLQTQQGLFEKFTAFTADLQRNFQQLYCDRLPPELLRLFNFNMIQEFYKNWLSTLKFPEGMQNPFVDGQNWADLSSFLNKFLTQEIPTFSAFSSRNLIDEMQRLFRMLQGAGGPGGDIYGQMFTTYQEFFNQLSNEVSSQGFEKSLEAFTRWQEQADRYLLAPQIGINRETAQDFSKLISLSFDYARNFAILSKLMEETARKSGNRFQAKLVERSLNSEAPLKFRDFCNLWTKENEAVYLEVLGSEEFAAKQAEYTASELRLRVQVRKLVEKCLDHTPIALKRDVDLAIREIQQLKREQRQARKQQQELLLEVKAAREFAASSEQRIKELEEVLAKGRAEKSADKAPATADRQRRSTKRAASTAAKRTASPKTEKTKATATEETKTT